MWFGYCSDSATVENTYTIDMSGFCRLLVDCYCLGAAAADISAQIPRLHDGGVSSMRVLLECLF